MVARFVFGFHSLGFESGLQSAAGQAGKRDPSRRFLRGDHCFDGERLDRQLHAGAVLNLLLQHLGRSPVFGVTDENGSRGLDHEPAFGDAGLLRRRQNFERTDNVVDLSVRSERQKGKAGERDPSCDFHARGE